jgi:hypothetical protein
VPSPTAPRLVTLALVLAVGAALGVHGLNAPNIPSVALSGGNGSAGGSSAASNAGAAGTTQTSSGASQSTSGSSRSSSGSSSSAPASSNTPSKKGPLLSSTQFAPFTYELFPTAAAQAPQAEDGFSITVKPGQNGENTLVIGAAGGGTLATKAFLASDKVYWIETSYGDDGPGQDANYGDDGYILTDVQGYITQK